MAKHFPRHARRGMSLIEQLFVVGLFALVFASALSMIESGRRFSTQTLGIANVEEQSQQMLFKLEAELADARGEEPRAILSAQLLSPQTSTALVDSSLGFPPTGTLLIARGTANEERFTYEFLDPNQTAFSNLQRGAQCTTAATHDAQTELIWQGLAEPLEDQVTPAAEAWDGLAQDGNGAVYFRGDGSGFSYRVPVDVNGNGNVLNGDELYWGAQTQGGVPTTDGWSVLYYDPKDTIAEADVNQDLNEDGDRADTFDVGQIRKRTWNVTDPANTVSDVGMGPSAILQEQCNWGSDLNGDGFDDPLFLWNPQTNELAMRLFFLGRSKTNMNLVREVRSVVFLRNEPEQLQN